MKKKSSWCKSDSVLLLCTYRIAGEERWLQASPTSHVGKIRQDAHCCQVILTWMMMKHVLSSASCVAVRLGGYSAEVMSANMGLTTCHTSLCFVNKALAWLVSEDNQLGDHRQEAPEPGMEPISFVNWTITLLSPFVMVLGTHHHLFFCAA